MNYGINAIETEYRGCVFRSRLEAKWAAMFDLLHWDWTYEPQDFNGWIPDFLLHNQHRVFVEVKPVTKFPQEVADQIDASGCRDEVLIVGAACPLDASDNPEFGWLRETHWPERYWGAAVFGRWENARHIGFCHADMNYFDRISGGYDGGTYGSGKLDADEIKRLWNTAGNCTRWEANKRRHLDWR